MESLFNVFLLLLVVILCGENIDQYFKIFLSILTNNSVEDSQFVILN